MLKVKSFQLKEEEQFSPTYCAHVHTTGGGNGAGTYLAHQELAGEYSLTNSGLFFVFFCVFKQTIKLILAYFVR